MRHLLSVLLPALAVAASSGPADAGSFSAGRSRDLRNAVESSRSAAGSGRSESVKGGASAGFDGTSTRGGTVDARGYKGSGRTNLSAGSSRTGGLRTSEPPAPGEEEEGGVFGALKSWAFPLGGAAAGALAGGLMGGPMGALLGATALGGAGYLVKKDYLMEGAGAAYGAVLGGLAGGPIGMAVGAAVGGLLGFVTRWIFS
mgnify:CR=1 FL=1